MTKEYVLKHRDADIAEFRIDKETENVDSVIILDDKFSPINIKASEGGKYRKYRHWNNFGILRDAVTGAWTGAIPLFDNGYSLWNNDFADISKTSISLSFEETNEDNLKYVNISNYIENVPDMVLLFKQAFENYENAERKSHIKEALKIKQQEVERKIKCGI